MEIPDWLRQLQAALPRRSVVLAEGDDPPTTLAEARPVPVPGGWVLWINTSPMDRLLNDIAHDLRGPLNNILGYISLIADGMATDPDEVRRYAEVAQRGVAELNERLGLVLELGRLRGGRLELRPEAVCLSVAVREAADRLTPPPTTLPEPTPLPAVRCDPVRLRQVLAALLESATDHAEAPPRIALADAGSQVEVVVVAYRARPPRRDHLAMLLAAELVAAMGGSLTFEPGAAPGEQLIRLRLPRA